jgi:hypothetical protein
MADKTLTAGPLKPVGAIQPRPALSPAAARARRARGRRRAGLITVRVEVEEFSTIAALLDRHRLTEQTSRRREIVGAALSEIIAEWTAKNSF